MTVNLTQDSIGKRFMTKGGHLAFIGYTCRKTGVGLVAYGTVVGHAFSPTYSWLEDGTCSKVDRLSLTHCIDGWNPIETAPKDGSEFLATEYGDVYACTFCWSNRGNDHPFICRSSDGDPVNTGPYWENKPDYINATHWMPLPQPPEADNE